MVLPKNQEMFVAAHDELRAGGDGALKYPIIIGIFSYYLQSFSWHHELSESSQFSDGFFNPVT